MSQEEKELDNKLNINNHFDNINKFVKSQKNQFLICTNYSEENNISRYEAMYIFTSFILHLKSIDDYFIIFQVEKEDPDNCVISRFLLSNQADDFTNKISEPTVVGVFVYALCLKDENFCLKDVIQFAPKTELLKKYDESFYQVKETQPNKSKKSLTDTNNQQTKPVESKAKRPEKANKINHKQMMIDAEMKHEEGEEFYYGGFKPTKQKQENNIKQKNNGPSENLDKKKKTLDEPPQKSNIEDNSSDEDENKTNKLKETNKNDNDEKKPKMVWKKRMVKKTKSYQNDKGYFVTKDEWVEEEYEEEEKSEPIIQLKPSTKQDKVQPKKKKAPKGQSFLESFFNK